jgi:hypothetical protein
MLLWFSVYPNSQVWKVTGSECWELQFRQKYITEAV